MSATFTLHRHSDPSGVSGTGIVAEGWESTDGKTVVIKWLSATPSVCIYSDVRHVRALHGHGGATEIVWDNAKPEADPELPTSLAPGWEDLLGNAKYGDYPDHDAHDPRD